MGCRGVCVSEREEDGDQFGYFFFFGDEFCLLINGDDGSLPNMHVQFVMIVLEILSDLTDFDTKWEKEPSRRLIFVQSSFYWLRSDGGLAFCRGVSILWCCGREIRCSLFFQLIVLILLAPAVVHYLFSVLLWLSFVVFFYLCNGLVYFRSYIYMGEYRSEHMHGICCD